MRTNLYHKSKSVAALAAGTAVTAATTGVTVDLLQAGLGDYRSVMFVIQAGAITDGTHTVSIEHSDNGTAWSAATIMGSPDTSFATADSNSVQDYGYGGTKRYVRLKITAAGATTGGVFGAVAVLYDSAGYQR